MSGLVRLFRFIGIGDMRAGYGRTRVMKKSISKGTARFTALALSAALAMSIAGTRAEADPRVTADALDQKVQAWMAADHIGSAALAVMRQRQLVGQYGHGGMLPTKAYPIASLSKAITAACLAPFIDGQHLTFDDQIGHVLAPYFAQNGYPSDPRFMRMTIGELLTHRAGLQRNTFGNSHDVDAAFRNTLTIPLQSDPGTQMSYSNGGYLILGFLVQVLSHTDYETACRKPLTAMGANGYIDPKMRQRSPNGGWEVSAVDYARFGQIFDEHSPLLGPITQKWLLSQPGNPSYSLGVNVKNTGHGYEFYHDGMVADGEGGGSYFLKTDNGYTAVVIWSGTFAGSAYSDLFKIMKSTLTSGD